MTATEQGRQVTLAATNVVCLLNGTRYKDEHRLRLLMLTADKIRHLGPIWRNGVGILNGAVAMVNYLKSLALAGV